MLPCSACCLLGLPMGIWALIVLIDNEVKRLFDGGYTPAALRRIWRSGRLHASPWRI